MTEHTHHPRSASQVAHAMFPHRQHPSQAPWLPCEEGYTSTVTQIIGPGAPQG